MHKIWFDEAWEDYLYWQSQDRKTIKRINGLIKDIEFPMEFWKFYPAVDIIINTKGDITKTKKIL
jgi:txe/yoeB family addiction module toxin|nr:type II toxin-antitoxin system YoeB family toxin [Lachnoanaerobaculum gingivalis]